MNKYMHILSKRFINGLAIILMLSGISATSATLAADVKGSKDHPLISHYDGSYIESYKVKAFDEYPLVIKSITSGGGLSNNPDSVMMLEGRVTKLRYVSPSERSTLEVLRNYEKALTDAGFEMLFSCKNNTDFSRGPFL